MLQYDRRQSEEQFQRDQRPKLWKQGLLQHDLGGLSRWIKGKAQDRKSVTLKHQGQTASTRLEAINMI